jgi:hypothetical protein
MFVSKYNKFDLLKNSYRYKVFKKNLKFKKLNRGITKFIINRKKYLKRKKKNKPSSILPSSVILVKIIF